MDSKDQNLDLTRTKRIYFNFRLLGKTLESYVISNKSSNQVIKYLIVHSLYID